jgi:peptidoglycan/xylan/chitin deacetylase (PgdA/CDA1 family)
VLARHQVPATFFVPGVTAERWPDTIRRIVGAGHEIGLHGHTHRRLTEMSEIEQRADFEQGLEALRELEIEPKGYRAPNWQITRTTLDLVAEHGLLYDSSLMDDDKPYVLRTGDRYLAELAVHWSLDDWEQYAFLPVPNIGHVIEAPSKVVELWTAELDAMRATGSLCVVTCHPFLSGRASRIRALEQFIEFAQNVGDVRIDRADWLAQTIIDGASPEGSAIAGNPA